MCTVHRVLPDTLETMLVVSYQPSGCKLPSTPDLFRQANGEKAEDPVFVRSQFGIAVKMPVRHVEPTIVRQRRQDIERFAGASFYSTSIEDHCLSPQSGGKIEPMRFDDRSDDYEGNTRYKCSRHHRGRKPEHKNKYAPYIGAVAPIAQREMIDLYL